MNARNIKTFINGRKARECLPPDHTDQISNEYMAAVHGMMAQIRYVQKMTNGRRCMVNPETWHQK